LLLKIIHMRTILVSSCFALLLAGCNNNNTATTEKVTPPPAATVDTPAQKPAVPDPEAKTTAWQGVQEITDNEFEKKVLKNTGLTVVDFNATWCGPCKLLAPIYKKSADQFAGKASFASMDVDQNPTVSQQYQITSIPLLLFFKDGKIVNKIVGLVNGAELNKAIEKYL
jgi:thioredoxin 1